MKHVLQYKESCVISKISKLNYCFFLKYGFRKDCLENSKQAQVEKVTAQGFWTVISNHKVNKYSQSADFFFLKIH